MFDDIRNEAIPMAGHRRDERGIGRIIAQCFSQRKDGLRQVRLFDDDVGPHAVEQRFLADRHVSGFDQRDERVEGFWGQRNRLVSARELTFPWVEQELPEGISAQLRLLGILNQFGIIALTSAALGAAWTRDSVIIG
jgi:hypothetical protein